MGMKGMHLLAYPINIRSTQELATLSTPHPPGTAFKRRQQQTENTVDMRYRRKESKLGAWLGCSRELL